MLTFADPLFVTAEADHRSGLTAPAGGRRSRHAPASRVRTPRRRIQWPRWRPVGAAVPPPRLSWP